MNAPSFSRPLARPAVWLLSVTRAAATTLELWLSGTVQPVASPRAERTGGKKAGA